ncbi:MAG: methyltransferase [Candidatus Loosdrechtia sp.]|uniref:methyltransferase n=1 Tax=Candidatus Loosdrechtia sp. TaxID=3101272 RepID=UPI003A637077|nr:MAG: methyltransferase [Candidatus Jettenia sp. AMX2]
MTQNIQMSVPPDAILMQMLFGALVQKSICIVAKLGIADLLAQKPQTAEELAAKTETHAPSLYRVLRTLASTGIFAETAGHTFKMTPIAELLRSDTPNSMRDFAILMGEDWIWSAWGELRHSVRTGEIAHEKVQGMSSFEFLEQNKDAGKIFNRAMTNLSLSVIPAIVGAYDFTGVGRLVDIAGGHGLLLVGILKANPQIKGILFDLPFVIHGADELLKSEGIRDRVELVSGDFFQSVPVGADVYMMKHIIHDWDDGRSIKILQNVRSAMNENSKVLIIEMVVPEGNEPSPSKALDLLMLVMEGGKERTKDEYRNLLEASGLRLARIVPTKSAYSVIEAERI